MTTGGERGTPALLLGWKGGGYTTVTTKGNYFDHSDYDIHRKKDRGHMPCNR